MYLNTLWRIHVNSAYIQGRPVNVKHDTRCVMGKLGGTQEDKNHGIPVVKLWPRHSALSRTSLVKDIGEEWLCKIARCLQVSARSSTDVSCLRTSWAGGYRCTMSTSFHLVVIASHPSYAVINRRWPSFSSCCSSCLEQSTTACHIRAVTASLPQSPQDTSLPEVPYIIAKFHELWSTNS